jgi:hypothetical protein
LPRQQDHGLVGEAECGLTNALKATFDRIVTKAIVLQAILLRPSM